MDDVDFVIVCVRGDGFGGRCDKDVDGVSGLLTWYGARSLEDAFEDCFEGVFELVKDGEVRRGIFLKHGERVVENEADVHE